MSSQEVVEFVCKRLKSGVTKLSEICEEVSVYENYCLSQLFS